MPEGRWILVHALSACVSGAPCRRAAWNYPTKITPAAPLQAFKRNRENGKKWGLSRPAACLVWGGFPYSLLQDFGLGAYWTDSWADEGYICFDKLFGWWILLSECDCAGHQICLDLVCVAPGPTMGHPSRDRGSHMRCKAFP